MIASLATALVGPLAGPELRRAEGRRWPFVVRLLVAGAAAVVVLGVGVGTSAGVQVDPRHLPFAELRGGLMALEGMALLAALVLAPAVLAGSLADETQSGAMALLLTTRVGPREIVAGRLAGRLGQLAPALLAGLPALAWLGGYAGVGPLALATMVALPAAVAFGAGGLAVAASAVARRGRDATLGVFALELLLFVARGVAWAAGSTWAAALGGLAALDPFSGLLALTWGDDPGPALASATAWLGLGVAGVALASWRLRPACRAAIGRPGKRRPGRRWRVPPVGERPMRWKEIHIERAGALGGFGTALGLLLVAYLVLGSLVGAGLILWGRRIGRDAALERIGGDVIRDLIVLPAGYFAWLIEWGIGLRAAVTIASERDRGTWDGLLLSPLTGTEIVLAKLRGSLHALRWLVAAAVFAWGLALACGELEPDRFALLLASLVVVGAFMAAVGVRASLASATATRAMAITLGAWLVAVVGAWVLGGLLILLGFVMSMTIASAYGFDAPGRLPFGMVSLATIWGMFTLLPYAAAAVMISSEARIRFDRIAGRIPGGSVELAVPVVRPAAPPPVEAGPESTPPPDPRAAEDDDILGPARPARTRAGRPGARDWS